MRVSMTTGSLIPPVIVCLCTRVFKCTPVCVLLGVSLFACGCLLHEWQPRSVPSLLSLHLLCVTHKAAFFLSFFFFFFFFFYEWTEGWDRTNWAPIGCFCRCCWWWCWEWCQSTEKARKTCSEPSCLRSSLFFGTIRIRCIYTSTHSLLQRQTVSWLPTAPSNRLLRSVWQRCRGNNSSYTFSPPLHTHTHTTRTERSGIPAPPFFRSWWIIHVEAVQQQRCRECQLEGKPCGFSTPQTEDVGFTATALMGLLCVAHQGSYAGCWCMLGIWLTDWLKSVGSWSCWLNPVLAE